MMRIILIGTILLVMSFGLTAQQQINNPGFEDWEDVGIGTDEPVHWSSIKTSDNELLNPSAPVVWGKSDDAHSGNASLHLFNRTTFGVVATGTITNGRAHSALPITDGYVFTDIDNDLYHTAFNQRPDSLVGWFKCLPAAGDFATVKFVLHKGYLRLPGEETNIVATAYIELPQQQITTWTRFAIAFDYVSQETPEYFLSVITSGNGYEAVMGSEAWYDDLAFVYNPDNINENTTRTFNAFQDGQLLHIAFDDPSGQPHALKIVNMSGQTLYNKASEMNQRIEIDVSNIAPGLYLIVAQYNNQMITRKIILN